MTSASTRNGRPNRKAVLFCPACEYEAPTDGEWEVRDRTAADGRRTVIECPACEQVVLSQPKFGLLA